MIARSLTELIGRHSDKAMLNKWLSFDHFMKLGVNLVRKPRAQGRGSLLSKLTKSSPSS